MIKKCLTTLAIIFFAANLSFAGQVATDKDFDAMTIDLLDPSMKVSQLSINFNVVLSQIEAFNDFIKATDKFKQSNVGSAYDDYKFVLDNVNTNDFGYTLMAGKLADYGLFYLSNLACKKMSDTDITKNHVDNIQKFFYPKKRLPYNEELYLAEAYSDIMFNDRSKETMEELLNNSELLESFDYANYVLALAAYKANRLPIAKQYVQVAVTQNPQNINYKILEAQILANGMKPQEALKIVNQLKKEDLTEAELQRRVNSIEQYVLYKCAKKDWERNYHLGNYYFYEGDYNKSIKTLQSALGKNKSNNAKVNALMSKVYLTMQEYEKAQEAAVKALKKDGNNSTANLTLGNINYLKQNYKKALKNYQKAEKDKNTQIKSEVKIAKTLQKMGEENKSKTLFEKVLKESSTEYEAYYNIAMQEPFKQLAYLKKALALNIMYIDAWLGLARHELSRDNFAKAQDYLSTAFYIDQNDFRYYYYQGLIYKNQDDMITAAMYFKKCLKLNPNCVEAQKELNL
ncbi:hypothetical protein IJ843_05980 [bacterium]|nr:hypothetical protein [bacterium]